MNAKKALIDIGITPAIVRAAIMHVFVILVLVGCAVVEMRRGHRGHHDNGQHRGEVERNHDPGNSGKHK